MGRLLLALLLGGMWLSSAHALEPFVVEDIRVEGLQRISAGTVFNYMPIKAGEELDETRAQEVVRELFKTGFFKDVRLERDGDVLVVSVVERPAIASIDISGNDSLETDELMKGLREVGFAEGRVFDRSLLDKVEQQLQRLYFARGKYGVKLTTTVTPLERNRVGISIDISEGTVARIHQINVVGNESFDDDDILDEFELTTPTLFSFYTGSDQYSRQKLAADLERLRSFYLDRGYINFNIDSTQVSITPDKKDVYITINITEGERFTVNKVKMAGDLVLPNEELFKLMKIQAGDMFSRKLATETTNKIADRLGNEGYAFANVNVIPDINEEEKNVILTFFVDPGKRTYVRRINFSGNTKTRDEVLRREMRQFESAWIDTKQVERSRQRLDQLGYFEEVTVETEPVPGTTDQVDVNFKVRELPSGNLLAGIGYSDSQGVIYSGSVSQDNFLGSGKRLTFQANTSNVNTIFNFGYTDPYYTVDGVSRGFSILYRETDASQANVAAFTTDVASVGMNFGIPFTEYNRASVGINLENSSIETNEDTPQVFRDFLADNGSDFATIRVTGSISHDTRNRRIFPTRGAFQILSGEVAGGELEYYKLTYRHLRFFPITKSLTLSVNGEVGYGDSYGGTTELPFFENFLAGGGRSVRGFEDNTLGPKDEFDEPIGGNLKMVGNVELILPVPFLKDSRAWRVSGFVDFGNVYGTDQEFAFDEIRYSTGLSVGWMSPFGVLRFSIAQPFNEQDGDETKNFQFSFGTGL